MIAITNELNEVVVEKKNLFKLLELQNFNFYLILAQNHKRTNEHETLANFKLF